MPEPSTANFLVYRDDRGHASARSLVAQLAGALANLRSRPSEQTALKSLLCAGELECSLCDAGSDDAGLAAAITDRLATLICRADGALIGSDCVAEARTSLCAIKYSGGVSVSRPEGFAYYALHPLDYADLVSSTPLDAASAFVIGIRSIGTTLSAVVAAQLNATGTAATRTTVRPTGHPYDRSTSFSSQQRDLIRQALSRKAVFLIVDEGPGRSGSSFLSVAEALEAEGVRCERIILLCSHQPNVDSLCAPDGARRWRRCRSIATAPTKHLPAHADQYIGGGEWRNAFVPEVSCWPASWPAMERLKFLSYDKQVLLKFEGHGSYGEQVRAREEMLATEFGAGYLGQEKGFGIHLVADGTYCQATEVSPALLRHFAHYCAWHVATFPAAASDDGLRQLERMAVFNCEQELGFAPTVRLELQRPVICDARMQPHKWIAVAENRWLKLDGSSHGDDHFFPGPTDIAWDLAGLCVEWELSASAREFLLAEYRRLTGDNPDARLPDYEVAYAAFRLGWSQMAAASVAGSPDEYRLLKQARGYRRLLHRLIEKAALAA